MKKIIITWAFILLVQKGVFGQSAPTESNALPNIIPPTPEAYAIGKFGSNPIGLFTGSVIYTLPLYTLRADGYSLPLSISYSSNGVKIDEVASRVGMQWKMDFAGVINRSIIGDPDEYGAYRPTTHDTSSSGFYNFLHTVGFSGAFEEVHPDLFSYSIPGYSGKFVLDKSRNIIQIPYNNLQITNFTDNYNNTDSFRIVTTDGTIYMFGKGGAREQTQNTSSGGDGVCVPDMIASPVTTAWYLNCIRLTNGQVINYVYEGLGNISYLTGVNQTFSFKPLYLPNNETFQYNENPYKTCYQLNEYSGLLLKEIQFPTAKIKLFYSSREDILGEKKLDSLQIVNSDSLVVKKYALTYQYSYNSSTAFDSRLPGGITSIQSQYPELRKRLFLTGAKDYMGIDSLPYKFEYNNFDSLAPRLSYAQDYWGNYNGVAQDGNFFSAYSPGALFYLWGGAEFGADRRANFGSAQKGILKRITYPTGGFTDYTYEPVDSFLSWKPIFDTLQFSGSVDPVNNEYTSSTFSLNAGVSKFLIAPTADPYIPPGPNDPQEPMPDTLIYVRIKNNNNDIIQSYAGSVWQEYYLPQLNIVNAGSYKVVVQSTYPPSVSFAIKLFKLLPNSIQPQTPADGLRVKSVTDNDGLGNIQNKRTLLYKYNWNEQSGGSGKSMNNPNDEGMFYSFFRGSTSGVDGYPYLLCQLHSSSLLPLYLNDLSAVNFEYVSEQFRNNSDELTGGIEHKFLVIPKTKPSFFGAFDVTHSNFPYLSDSDYVKIMVPGGSYTNTDLHNGTELETRLFKMNNASSKKTTSITKYFQSIDPRWSYTDTLYSIRLAITRPQYSGGVKYFYDYDVNKYFIYSNWMHPDSVLTITYPDTGDSLAIKQFYTYGGLSHMQPTIVKQINSRGDSISSTYKYPYDFSGTSPYTEMLARNIITPVVEQSEKNITLNKDLVKTKTNYQFWQGNTIIAPATVEQKIGNNNSETRLHFYSYDNRGNVITVLKENDIKVSYIWNYNLNYPTAEVKNADSVSIACTSFEADGKGGWTFSGSTTTHPSAPTGQKGYSLVGGNITRSGLSSGTTYIITYWKRDSTSSVTVNSGSGTLLTTKNGWKLYSHEIAGTTSLTISGTAYIDELRLYPKGALMTTYTYTPLMGLTTQCDGNNRISYYEYDNFGRLKLIRDQDRKVLKRVDYKYQATNQQ